jgi:hypothetical protein
MHGPTKVKYRTLSTQFMNMVGNIFLKSLFACYCTNENFPVKATFFAVQT